MIDSLYDCFKHWSEKGTVWLYSDPHFNDKEMTFLRKNYIGDDEQVKRINSKVGKNDTLIILGDVGDASYISKLRGYKVLILGNHDKGATYYKLQETTVKQIKIGDRLIDTRTIKGNNGESMYFKASSYLFNEVYEGPLTIGPKIILSHEPIDVPGMFNIHGHDHSNWKINNPTHLNLCAEMIDYTPVSLNKLIKQGLTKHIINIHRQNINKAIDRKEAKATRALQNKDKNDVW